MWHTLLADSCTAIGVFCAVSNNKGDSLNGMVFQQALRFPLPKMGGIKLLTVQTSQQAERLIIVLMKETK